MSDTEIQRRLAAILAADLAGYSRLMGEDEAGTLAAVRKLRVEVIEPKVAEHQGRLFKSMGDGFLVEFPSVVNAVACAAAIQTAMAGRNADMPESRQIQLRIGVHLGDVISEGGDVYGDGVNVAARIEGLAPPGGVAVSSMVHDNVGSRLNLSFEDMGDQHLKNIAKPVRVYRLAAASRPVPQLAQQERTKPSIAVLPFTNMSGDAEQEYFSDGITEDIITELSRFRNLFVIARNSSFTYKGRAVDVKKVGKELGVAYVLEGSVRRAGNKVRVTCQLIDTKTDNHVWADRYDRELLDIFAIQDEIARTVAATLEGKIADAIAKDLVRQTPANMAAYECVLQGRQLIGNYNDEKAIPLLLRAIELEPTYGQAHAWLSIGRIVQWFALPTYALGDDAVDLVELAIDSGRRAVSLDERDSLSHASLACALVFRESYDESGEHFRRAIEINPSDALSLLLSANWWLRTSQPEQALKALDDVLRLDPFPPTWYWETRANVLIMARRYDDAIAAIRRFQPIQYWHHAYLAICLVNSGRDDSARREIHEFRRLAPHVDAHRLIIDGEPYKDTAYKRFLVDSLVRAGLEEHYS